MDMQINKFSCRQRFNKAANTYDSFAAIQNLVLDSMISELCSDPKSDQWILDLGSGTGAGTKKLVEKFPRANILQLDFAEQMLKQSVQHNGIGLNAYPVCADIEYLPLPDQTMDLVFSSLSIQWCDDIQRLIKSLKQCLKSNGRLHCSTLAEGSLKELNNAWRSIDTSLHVNRFHSAKEIHRHLINSGFNNVHLHKKSLKQYYQDVHEYLGALKGLGVTNSLSRQRKSLTGIQRFKRFLSALEQEKDPQGIPLSYEVIIFSAESS